MPILWCHHVWNTPTSIFNFIPALVTKQPNQQQTITNNQACVQQTHCGRAGLSLDGSKSPPDQIPRVYYSRKPNRRDGSEQDVTSSSIDWLRLKIGESGQIDTLGAWTEGWDAQRQRPVITAAFILFLCWRVFLSNGDRTNKYTCTETQTHQQQLVRLFSQIPKWQRWWIFTNSCLKQRNSWNLKGNCNKQERSELQCLYRLCWISN